jgi:DNA-binding MarR family transcriptional regulator
MLEHNEDARRLAVAIAHLAEQMDADLGHQWDSLTGLQILMLKVIDRHGRISRGNLVREARTSRAAMVPGLAKLLREDLINEAGSGEESHLTVGAAGRELLDHVDRSRALWVRRAAHRAAPDEPVDIADMGRSVEQLLEASESSPVTAPAVWDGP